MLKPIRYVLYCAVVLVAGLLTYRMAGPMPAVSAVAIASALCLGLLCQVRHAAKPTPGRMAEVRPPQFGKGGAGRVVPPRERPAPTVHLYHIAYSDETRAELPEGARLLENTSGRPDWREYGAMRDFLLHQPLCDEDYYGFFSPKFEGRAKMGYVEVQAFVQEAAVDTDVYLFSPAPDFGAFFLNSFEQFDFVLPGFMACSQAFVEQIGLDVDLRHLVMDSRQTVFSNYIVARPAFWRAWLEVSEKLYALCEGPDHPLKLALTTATHYPGAVEYKVFVMERIASLLLATENRWSTRPHDTFRTMWSETPLRDFPGDAVLCDALKTALREQGFAHYRSMYETTRQAAVAAYDRWA